MGETIIMSIPVYRSKEIVKAPKEDTGKALDPSQYILGAAQANIAAMGYIGSAVKDIGAFVKQMQTNEEAMLAQDAFNKYLTQRNEEDLILNQKKNLDAVTYQPDYYKHNEKAHADFVHTIDSISNPQIRERYRQMANEENLRRHSKTQEYVFSQKENAEALSLKGTQELMSQSASDSLSHILPDHNQELFEGNFKQADDITREYYQNHGYPQEAVEMISQDLRNKFLVDAAEHLSRQTGGLKPAIDLIRSQEKNMNHDDFRKIAGHYESQYLNLKFAENPQQFIVNGKYSDKIASQYAPDLTEEERRKRITEADSNGSSLSGIQLNDQMEFENQWYKTYILQGMSNYLDKDGNDIDIEKIREGAKNGDLKAGEFFNNIATAMQDLKAQAKYGDIVFNKHTPEFVKNWQKRLSTAVAAFVPNTKGKATKNGWILADNATMADVVASKIHKEFDNYRKRNVRFWVFGRKDTSDLMFQEADAITEALSKLSNNSNANWGSAATNQREYATWAISFALVKNHPKYNQELQNTLRGIAPGTEDAKKEEATLIQQKKDFFLNEYKADSTYALPLPFTAEIAVPAGTYLYQTPFITKQEKDYLL